MGIICSWPESPREITMPSTCRTASYARTWRSMEGLGPRYSGMKASFVITFHEALCSSTPSARTRPASNWPVNQLANQAHRVGTVSTEIRSRCQSNGSVSFLYPISLQGAYRSQALRLASVLFPTSCRCAALGGNRCGEGRGRGSTWPASTTYGYRV